MCVFEALWASKGVAGFMRTREGVSKGGGGFNWARKSSPRGPVSSRKREKVRPERSRHPTFGVFVLAGRVFRGRAAGVAVLGEFFRANRHCAGLVGDAVHFRWLRWGFCAMRSPLAACRRRVGALDGVIPPVGGGATATSGGVAAKVQTHWTKVAENGLFWLNGAALWRIRCRAWCVVRTRTRYCEPKPAISHANPLLRV